MTQGFFFLFCGDRMEAYCLELNFILVTFSFHAAAKEITSHAQVAHMRPKYTTRTTVEFSFHFFVRPNTIPDLFGDTRRPVAAFYATVFVCHTG